MPVEQDDSAWPVVTLRIRGTLLDEEEDEFIEASVGFAEHGERYVAVIDLLEAATPSARFIRGQAAAMGKYADVLSRRCVGMAFVIDSAMLRGGLRAIFHFQGPPSPHIVVRTVEDALRWAGSKLARS